MGNTDRSCARARRFLSSDLASFSKYPITQIPILPNNPIIKLPNHPITNLSSQKRGE